MPAYRLSKLARLDLIEIADYTVDTWGLDQANRYLDGLVDCFESLVKTPKMGRPCDKIRRGYRRVERGKHVIIYRADDDEIFICRILHQSMMPGLHWFEDM